MYIRIEIQHKMMEMRSQALLCESSEFIPTPTTLKRSRKSGFGTLESAGMYHFSYVEP